jgi:crotonobetainyl-CoA:carnitine CoA-transferase CaiB-like acyl-CoA transferase
VLSPYRVLDLTDHRGELTALILGDLGAEVIRVEPPEGCEARRRGPRIADAPEDRASLQFYAYNRNKQSIAIDVSTDAGRDTFMQLVATADIVIESSPGGLAEQHGIDFDALCSVQPHIVHTRISPYGTKGPYAAYAASDLTIAAMGGPVSLQGVPERAPVRVSVPQVWRHAGAEAAIATMVGLKRMQVTHAPQSVDVSAQAVMTWTMLNAMEAHAIQGHDFERQGSTLQLGRMAVPLVFECADGHVVIIGNGELVNKLMDWLIEDGIAEAWWRDEDWAAYELKLLSGQETPLSLEEMLDSFARLLRPYKKNELFERGLSLGATIAPVNTISDLLSLRHLEARDFWRNKTLPNGQVAKAPGAFAVPSSHPLNDGADAPAIDEHGDAIRAALKTAPRAPVPPKLAAQAEALPFEGLKVADFSWIGVGPISAKYLADHGATVVRVESGTRPDKLRLVAPFKGSPGIDTSQFFADMNSSKLGLTLNLKKPAARDVARKLIGWSDVYLQSFTPGAADRAGIGYSDVQAIDPSIIMLSTCLMGQTGPAAAMAGYGYHAGAVAGFYELTGWPDLPPAGPWMAYTDTIAPRFIGALLMAALDHRERTGEGQHIDGAQFEMGLQFLAPEILDYQTNGHLATRAGNSAPDAAPHAVYPCAGDDQWCAIAVEDDATWLALRRALGDPEWAQPSALDTLAGRKAQEAMIDERLTEWTCTRSPSAVMEQLLEHRVPAGKVQRSQDLLADPQYAQRGFYRELDHPEIGRAPYAGHQFQIDGYASAPRFAAPTLGQHSFEILSELLEIDADAVAGLYADGVIE